MVAGVVIAAHLTGLAAEDRVRLRVVRDAGGDNCPDDDDLAARVRERIGSEPFRTDDDDSREVRVGIERKKSGELTARIVLFAPNGTRLGVRVLHGDADCASLADDMVLAVAIAIDPLLLVRRRPPPAHVEPVAITAPTPVDEPEPKTVVTTRVVRASSPGFDVPAPASVTGRALLLMASGVGIIATPSFRAQGSLDYGVLDVDGGLRFDLPARYPAGDSGALLDVALLALDGAVCVGFDPDANIGLRGCGELEAGVLGAQGVGFIGTHEISAPWLAVGARGAVDLRILPEIGLVFQGDVLSPLLRPRFVDDTSGEVYAEPDLFGWDLGMGVEVQIR